MSSRENAALIELDQGHDGHEVLRKSRRTRALPFSKGYSERSRATNPRSDIAEVSVSGSMSDDTEPRASNDDAYSVELTKLRVVSLDHARQHPDGAGVRSREGDELIDADVLDDQVGDDEVDALDRHGAVDSRLDQVEAIPELVAIPASSRACITSALRSSLLVAIASPPRSKIRRTLR